MQEDLGDNNGRVDIIRCHLDIMFQMMAKGGRCAESFIRGRSRLFSLSLFAHIYHIQKIQFA